ncbi:zinc finger, C2H2 type [Ancylostoma ceylanicum]|uniref:Zinc finger, C2H2 type n=1 Tax=Ancylostoma ceylanicum TaxID=53326 RepID=A0A0D6LB63_9BILA|nr:zinc finger, C2H2 type [Ancylostoma ceylanicum]
MQNVRKDENYVSMRTKQVWYKGLRERNECDLPGGDQVLRKELSAEYYQRGFISAITAITVIVFAITARKTRSIYARIFGHLKTQLERFGARRDLRIVSHWGSVRMSESGTTQSHLEAGIPLKDVASCANSASDFGTTFAPRDGNFTCDLCEAVVSTKNNLKRHMRRFHSDCEERRDDNNISFRCGTCSYKGASRESLKKHFQRNRHQKPEEMSQKPRCGCVICPLCSSSVELQEQLVTHIQEQHNIPTQSGHLEFLTLDESHVTFYNCELTSTSFHFLFRNEKKTRRSPPLLSGQQSAKRQLITTTTKIYFKCSRPEAFISDDCPVFWNAFVNVFPDAAAVSRRLLCARQVERAVFAHLKKEFPSDHAATQNLTEYLKLLFIESNKPRWQKALTYFLGLLADLQLDKGNQRISKVVTEFESCSRTKYLAPVSKYRAPYSLTFAIMNTNMFDERYNKTIKYDYLYKSANSRIEYVVRELIDSVNDFYCIQLQQMFET